jgi:hypothetical protein
MNKIRKGINKTKKKTITTKKKMITTRKQTNCSKNRIEPQELPHIISKRKRMEEEQELNNTQFFSATIPAHK